MKLKFALVLFVLSLLPVFAQSATRPVVIAWAASPSSGVTGYSVYLCTVPAGGTSCTPTITGSPTATVTGLTYTANQTTQAAYGISVVANGPPCSATSPLTTPCGNSAPVTAPYTPVPPSVAGESNVVVVVP